MKQCVYIVFGKVPLSEFPDFIFCQIKLAFEIIQLVQSQIDILSNFLFAGVVEGLQVMLVADEVIVTVKIDLRGHVLFEKVDLFSN